MYDLAIVELKKDWAEHARRADQGDRRCAYAARETYERLIELGADPAWLDWALANSNMIEKKMVSKGD